MDIKSGCGYPAASLSNFTPRKFIFDGIECRSMEGLLQSFKFDKQHIQEVVCQLIGKQAKAKGRARNQHWQKVQTLWWKGVPYKRDSKEYQELITLAYDSMFDQSESLQRALAATGNATITHSIGHNDSSMTVLTEREFCRQLTRLRTRLRS